VLSITAVPSLKGISFNSGAVRFVGTADFPLGLLGRHNQLERHGEESRTRQTVARATRAMAHCCERRFNRIRGPYMLSVFGRVVEEREQCVAVFRNLLDGLYDVEDVSNFLWNQHR
jgi:hypothetical protein